MDRLLITGGAGFVGSNLAVSLAARHPDWEIVVLDNLYRRGSELNLPRLEQAGVEFVHGDVREPEDLARLPRISALIECSAEPSVMSGVDGDTGYLVHTNLTGAYNCLELARRDGAFVVFLSTSRVYPVAPQVELELDEAETRFEIAAEQAVPGASPGGHLRAVPARRRPHPLRRHQARRRAADRGVPGGTRRAGGDRPLRRHRRPLADGQGRPGRLHPLDARPPLRQPAQLHRLRRQGQAGARPAPRRGPGRPGRAPAARPGAWDGRTVNVGGGRECSLSLLETTAICRELTGNEVPIEPVAETRAGDVPIYLSDCAKLFGLDEWRPRRSAEQVLADIHEWVAADEARIAEALNIDTPAGEGSRRECRLRSSPGPGA